MLNCKKFSSCSAPVCPLDPHWDKRTYRNGEPICHYLSEYSKPTTRANVRGAIDRESWFSLVIAYPEIKARYGPIKKRLQRSARTPSRLGGAI